MRKEFLIPAALCAALAITSCDSGSKGTDPQAEDSSGSVAVTSSSGGLQTSSSSGAAESLSSGVVPGSSSGGTSTVSGSSGASSGGTQVRSSSSAAPGSSDAQTNSSSSSATAARSSSSVTVKSSSSGSSSSSVARSSSSWYLPLNGNLSYGSMTDPRDGKKYATIVLHGYTVMAQNLDYGTQVPGMKSTDNQADDSKVEKYCYNDSALYCERCGGLYQWAEALALPSRCNAESCADLVDTVGFHRGICPEGWHLPGFVEWGNKIAYSTVAKEMKSEIYWYQGGGGSNSTGFTFLPAGNRGSNANGGGV